MGIGVESETQGYVHGGNGWLGKDNAWPQRVRGGEDVWESIRLALPDGNDNRIIITTRRGDISNSFRDDDSIDIHKVQPLSPHWAEQLFYKKAFSGVD